MPRYIPFIHNIQKAKQGDKFIEEFEFESGFLSGKSAKCQVKVDSEDSPVLEFSTEDGTITIVGNILTLICPADKFKTIEPMKYWYDVQLFTNEADVHTVIEGTFDVVKQITK